MSLIIKPLLILCYVIVNLQANEIESDDPDKIESHSYDYYQVVRPKEVADTCELDEMLAYGLSGDATSLGEKNEICPHISQNCCGKKDQSRIWEYWHRDRKRQEYYHRTVLKIMKYILGYGKEWYRIASAIKEDYMDKERGLNKGNSSAPSANNDKNYLDKRLVVNANKYCEKAAEYVLRLDFNTKEKVYTYYRMINEKVEFMENARRSFYCMICSIEGQRAIDTWRVKHFSNIRYNTKFCETIVNHSFRINYELYNTYNTYISSLLRMKMCVSLTANGANRGSGSGNADFKKDVPPVQLTIEERDAIEDPLENQKHFAFEACNTGKNYIGNAACIFYCGKFNIAKPSPELDLSTHALKAVFTRLEPLEEVFITSRNNFFLDDMNMLKRDIQDNYKRADKSSIFYKTTTQNIDISRYSTNFLIGGLRVDPMEVAKDTPLPMNYKSAKALAVGMIGLLFAIVNRG